MHGSQLTHPTSLTTYGAEVRQLKADVGGVVPLAELEKALQADKYKVVTFTHVDTSTGVSLRLPYLRLVVDFSPAVLSDAKSIAETVKRVSPDTLVRTWNLVD